VYRSPVLWSSALLDHGYRAEWRQIQRLKARIIAAAKIAFHLDELYVEADVINRMLPGEVHIEHSDNSDYLCATHGDHRWVDGDCAQGTWVPMSERWFRDISAVLYLNDDFEGGSLRFEQYDYELQPRRGMVTVFPSNRTFLHHVTPVTSGVRYAMPLWLTRDWEHQNP
jgi:predicted 2-oxoglutarate/Fe(II)-dependent dioxygenase YbiX